MLSRLTDGSEPRMRRDRMERYLGVTLEFACGVGLFQTHAANFDGGDGIVFGLHLATRQTPQHRKLSGVRQCVGYGTLKQFLYRPFERLSRSEIGIERS